MPAKDVKYWKEELRKAKLYQDKGGRLNKWKEYKKWYRNEYPDSVVSVNKAFGIGRAMVPQLYFKSPTILVHPRKQNVIQQAKVLEQIDMWLIDHIGFKSQIKYMILDAYITNIGVGKIGYHSISTELPTPSTETTEAVAEMIGAEPAELEEELLLRKWSYHDYIRPDCPWYLRVRPQDVLVPWGFVDEHEAPWMAYRIVRPLADVKEDPTYTGTSKLEANIKIDASPSNTSSPNLMGQVGAQSDFVELFEIWDKRDGTVRVLSEDHDKWLRDEEHEMHITGLPSTILRFNPDGEDFWGVSDLEQIRKQINELNENRTHEIETKRLANVKAIVDTNIVSEEEIVKMEKGKPGPIIRGVGNVVGAYTQFKLDMPQDFYRVDEIIDKDIREIIGFSRNQAGEFDTSRRTATEAGIVQQAHELRADERRDLVADLIAETFRDKIHPLIFDNWTQERVIKVTQLGGWVKYTGDQIRGDYDLMVVPDSVLPLTRRQEQEMAMQAFRLFKGDIMVKQRELYIRVMQAFKDFVPDPEQLLQDEKVVQEQQQAQQQQAMQLAIMKNSKQGGRQRAG
jgi:hypothetical protein